ncbi:MAG: sugar ABC transporter substrate-binding protein [Lachnospiraceae bacterium]
MKKKVLSVVLCIAMVATMLVGCGGKTTADTEDKEDKSSGKAEDFDWKAHEGTTLNVMFNEHTYSKAVIAKIKDFEDLTGIKVEYSSTPEENYFDKLNTSLSSRSGSPDVFMTGAYQIWEYAPAGYIEPLEDYINDASKTSADYDFADFYKGVVGALQWDLVPGHAVGKGSQWALPMGYELNNLAYNKRVFDEKGIAVPKTTDDLLKAATDLKEFAGAGSYGIALRGTRNWATIHPGYMSLFATWGAKDFEIEDGKLVCKLDSKEAIEMTDYWVKLIKEGGSPQWSTYTWYQAGADLGAGKAAMLFDATCNGYFQNYPADASAEAGNIAWTGIPVPKEDAKQKSNIWIWSLAMNADSKNKDAAWYFLQYFTSKDFMSYSATDGACADCPRTSIAESDEYKNIVGASTGYLEALDELLPNATIQFTPQPYFFECTTEWAATLQDLVTSDKYASTEEAMKELSKKLTETVADLEVEE